MIPMTMKIRAPACRSRFRRVLLFCLVRVHRPKENTIYINKSRRSHRKKRR